MTTVKNFSPQKSFRNTQSKTETQFFGPLLFSLTVTNLSTQEMRPRTSSVYMFFAPFATSACENFILRRVFLVATAVVESLVAIVFHVVTDQFLRHGVDELRGEPPSKSGVKSASSQWIQLNVNSFTMTLAVSIRGCLNIVPLKVVVHDCMLCEFINNHCVEENARKLYKS